MKKNMVISKGMVFVSDKEGIKPGVEFTNNIVDKIVLQTIIEHLDKQIDKEHSELDSKITERKTRFNDYKKMLAFTTGASVVVPCALSLLSGMHKTTMDTVLGEMNGALGFSIIMIPSLLLFSQFLISYNLTLRPSKKSINGYSERLNYQIEVLQDLKGKLFSLETDKANDKINEFEENTPLEIDVDSSLKYYEDSAKLRYVYGSQYKEVVKKYHDGTLTEYLKNSGLDETAIVDFILFVEHKISQEKEEARLEGRVYNGK